MLVLPKGLRHIPGHIDRDGQQALVEDIRAVVRQAPLYRPQMPRSGKPFSVRMTNCGQLGWVADKTGYRYQGHHPSSGDPWPPIPKTLLSLWADLTGESRRPEACLVNFYDVTARMGLHQDRDEGDFSAPVLSVSLGDACLFRFGGIERTHPTKSFRLESGDVVVLGGESRLIYHGVDRIYPMTSTLLKDGGRINLTLRRVADRV
ncbi:alpha-ketoglutarate-dependent dioxygenase AlkB [uncultured Hoeflea sp.]|uniref:alpha-ketoglutarate-dependent dioxygenase AlkB family protein n=1 Tax=uncultured Hoeflea sp. TaxID=538666 RepID=UPI00260DCEE8|nr:alpha-ketoglutarate-dependent dioxygenase AlkB [uncultured Hoeflea sp.]